jgi:hypothetical protein
MALGTRSFVSSQHTACTGIWHAAGVWSASFRDTLTALTSCHLTVRKRCWRWWQIGKRMCRRGQAPNLTSAQIDQPLAQHCRRPHRHGHRLPETPAREGSALSQLQRPRPQKLPLAEARRSSDLASNCAPAPPQAVPSSLKLALLPSSARTPCEPW